MEARSGPGGTADEVVALGALGGSLGGGGVLVGGGLELAAELVEVGADGVPLVPVAERRPHPLGLGETARGAVDVPHRDGPVEDRGGVVVLGVVARGRRGRRTTRGSAASRSPPTSCASAWSAAIAAWIW